MVCFCGVAIGALSSLPIILLRKRELVALLYLRCGYLCSVSHPHSTLGRSEVCGCGISWSYSLFCEVNSEDPWWDSVDATIQQGLHCMFMHAFVTLANT